ncbi:MAG: hypothetical protein ACSHX9_00850 [Luteolibacter sp.]
MKSRILCIVAVPSLLMADVITWDNEATINGGPDFSFHSDENWDPDGVPGASDDVRILDNGPVRLFSTLADVKTIVCTVPLELNDTLQVAGSSRFSNSLSINSIGGRLRANGLVRLQGANDLTGINLDGSGSFINEGDVRIGTRGINADFLNEGTAELFAANALLGTFNNSGTLNLGENGGIGSSTLLSNEGMLIKDKAVFPSNISAKFTQLGGQVEVAGGCVLTFDGVEQQFLGGNAKVDGVLVLSQLIGGTPVRVFEGLSKFEGQGTVVQARDFELKEALELNLPNTPGYQAGSLTFGKAGIQGVNAILTNRGFMTIEGTPVFEAADDTDESNLFQNSFGATVEQPLISNPNFAIPVTNGGTWTASAMRLSVFDNNNMMILRGESKDVLPSVVAEGGEFRNQRTVKLDTESAFNSFTFKTLYNQTAGATTEVGQGSLELQAGSSGLVGKFEIGLGSKLDITAGNFASKGELNFEGEGSCNFGERIGTQFFDPAFIGGTSTGEPAVNSVIKINLGANSDGIADGSRGFFFKSGSIGKLSPLSEVYVINDGYFGWQGGTISASSFTNNNRLDILAGGRPRRLGSVLVNNGHKVGANNRGIFQFGSFILGDSSTGAPGALINSGIHRLRPGASISGTTLPLLGYINEESGTFICEQDAQSVISCGFDNLGLVKVTDESLLVFTNLSNLDENGVLTGGRWEIGEFGEIGFTEDIFIMVDVEWTGPGARTVKVLKGAGTVLSKTTSETHPNALTVKDGALLESDAGTTTTVPGVTVENGGQVGGNGKMVGDVEFISGILRPGSSVGVLEVEGDVDFGVDGEYEWEVESVSSGDRLDVTGGTVTLGGALRPKLLGGYVPAVGASFTILTAPVISGTFDFLDLSGLPPGLGVTVGYNATSVTVTFGTTSLPTYDSWKATRFNAAEQADVLVSGTEADPDGDGLSNVEEYGYGLNPKEPDVSPVRIVAATRESIDLKFPWASGTEAEYVIQTAPGLTGFGVVSGSVTFQEELLPGVDELTVRTLHTDSDKQFNRVGVYLPDP